MKPSPTRLYGLVSLMTFFWGVNYIAAKFAMRAFPALLIGPLRAAIAAVMLLPLFLWQRRRTGGVDRWSAREVTTLSLLGIFGITLNQALFVIGLQYTSVAHGALVIATTPLQVLALAALRGQESVTLRKMSGILVAVGGIAVLNFSPSRTLHGATPLGDFIVFLGALSFSLYSVFGKEIALNHDPITANFAGYAAGAVVGSPLLWWESRQFDYLAVSAAGWTALMYMVAISSVLCYLIYYYALSRVPASRVAAFSYGQPVVAALAGLVVLGEPITLAVACGGMLVLSGVWLTGRG